MRLNISKPLFSSLNKKILVYFVAFAFIPLLTFSILGYYLNKDLLTDIAFTNLNKYNIQFNNILNDYLNRNKQFENNSIISELQEMIKINSLNVEHELYLDNKKLLISSDDIIQTKSIQNKIKDYYLHEDTYPRAIISKNNEPNYLTTYSFIEQQKIYVFSFISNKGIYNELNAFRNKILFANIILAIILVSLAFVYSKLITEPIQKLVEAIQHIRKGNLDYKIEVNSKDEINTLAKEFELMRLQLQESYQGLEEKIKERTLELHEAQAQITQQEKMASLGLMAAGIAHEIGNPLTSISSMAQVIKRKIKDEKINEFVNNILSNIDRISVIVRELVDFSRPSNYDTSMVSVNEIINTAVGIVKYDKRSKHIKYNLALDRNLPKTFLVGDHLLQVFINILINAVDATKKSNNEITVTSKLKAKNILVSIEDKGSGIEKDRLNKIFEPFYTTKEVGKGTGLGLTVSYGLVKKIGGEINVKSEVEEGSTFEILLPITKKE